MSPVHIECLILAGGENEHAKLRQDLRNCAVCVRHVKYSSTPPKINSCRCGGTDVIQSRIRRVSSRKMNGCTSHACFDSWRHVNAKISICMDNKRRDTCDDHREQVDIHDAK